ncbi:lipoxygenase family protein [Nannocystis punicea]|uniref:Lipoxygenase family protein n=1 Tax=Nannocystis punicea TaxID=2995304 RepID=A0ABY7H8K0_9BACT|nr:lipoxygenase family protein [Nannocystis poenicansa]WAS95594.1 lipoxygenase family protein [Nannocystis poenicansa]
MNPLADVAPPFELLPPQLSLPGDDPDPAGRERRLELAREAYRYSYDKANIRGLAMCEALADDERPEPGWRRGLTGVAARLVVNAVKVSGLPERSQVAELLRAVEADGLSGALREVGEVVVAGEPGLAISRLADYAGLFHEWEKPAEVAELHLDSTFARMRLAGPNPAWLRRVDPRAGLPPDFAVTAEHYAAAAGEADTLAAAAAEGRLFVCEYRELLALQPGSVPVPAGITIDYATDPVGWDAAYKAREAAYAEGGRAKALVAPLALFSAIGGRLVPIAIQLFPQGHRGRRYPVFTPRDGLAWTAAKAAVHAADGTVHETVSHLGLTHLVQEAFCLAVHNNLSARHPLHRLLVPHFEGTLSINAGADQSLVSPAGYVDKLLLPTIGGAIQLCAQAVQSYDFNASMFPRQLAARGVDDAAVLRDYPYRDDGELVWAAIESFVAGYVQHHYRSDEEVALDGELQAMVRQVGVHGATDAAGRQVGGGIRGVGEDGAQVRTRGYLIQMITQIVWNGSAQHAAVNFPQADPMVYSPHYPLALHGPLPAGPAVSEAEYMQMLPDHESAHIQLFILKLLGTHYHGRLGQYSRGPASWFGPDAGRELEAAFGRRLAEVERTISERNLRRPAYRYLLPSQIPQSINI